MAGIELTGEQHQFQVIDELWEGITYITSLRIAEGPANAGTVGQEVESIALLYPDEHQTAASRYA
ncbi:Uncharacterised protein [Serratia proteamaculans]|nr:Uncharacterised protein [Serratia proteamaculans]CAI1838678.1 Uncharacterised protein [Serratia proteamaculans]